jgi:hypothetical protein
MIARMAGDEFLCAMSNLTASDARQRFSVISSGLAATPDARGIRTGFATMHPGDTGAYLILIARADDELADRRRGNDPPD